jgi:protein-L-isoaspartate(D-aspartate) O-methyltransferase
MDDHHVVRRFYARLITALAGVEDPSIVDAFTHVKREAFVGAGPWHIKVPGGYLATETDDPVVLYQDVLVALSPERGINNGEPSLHARCIGAASPRAGDVVVYVGAGTGYYTAIFAHVVGQNGHVHAYEIETDMAMLATENLAEHDNVSVYAKSALEAPVPSADVIYVNAGATHVPAVWLEALVLGGRLVLPLTPNERLGCMLLATRRSEDVYAAQIFSTAGFIPCIGARDEEQSRIVAEALDGRSTDEVRSLRRGSEVDGTAWCIGRGWWLSTAEPNS